MDTHEVPLPDPYPIHQSLVGYGGEKPWKNELGGWTFATEPPAGAGLSVPMGPKRTPDAF